MAVQGNNLTTFPLVYIDLRNKNSGIGLFKGHETCVQENIERFPTISRLLLDGFQILTSTWRSALKNQQTSLIHANFGKGGYY